MKTTTKSLAAVLRGDGLFQTGGPDNRQFQRAEPSIVNRRLALSRKSFCASLAVLLICVIAANARVPVSFEDATIVERAEVIAVGHLKEDSVQYVPHSNVPHPMSWEHQAILVITETIKGKPGGKEIPIVINYGLEPRIGGHEIKEDGMRDVRGGRKDYPTNLVEIFRRQGSSMIIGEGPVVDDASKDYIWFLRRGGSYRGTLGTNDLGVMDPQDIEPLKMKEYLGLYLLDNPEAAVKEYADKHPEVSIRAQQWLNHQEIKSLVKIEDPALRFAKLLPHFLKQEAYPEIRQGIVSCGAVGGEKLVPVFQDPIHQDRRLAIISIWGAMNYRQAVPLLVQVLVEADRFWAEQTITNDWRKADSGSELARKRQATSGEIYYSVAVLRELHDPRALEAIALTKRRWQSIPFADPRILEECNGALDPKTGLYLTGMVRNPAGEPVAGAIVTVWPNAYHNPEVKTDASGRYEIAWRLFKSDAPSFLVARSFEQNLAVACPMEGGLTNVDVSLQPGLTLSTKVEEANGIRVTNAVVRVGVMNGKLWFGCHPDARGRLEVTALPQADGSYNLNISAEGFRNDYQWMSFQIGQTNHLEFPTVVLLRSSK